MKAILHIAFLLLPLSIFSQECDLPLNDDNQFELVKVIPIENTEQSKLYSLALLAFSEFYSNSNELIQLSDKENGIIVAQLPVFVEYKKYKNHTFNFRIKLEFKDNRFKLTTNYIDHKYVIGVEGIESHTCSCSTPITEKKYGCNPCNVSKREWAKSKCKAIAEIHKIALDFKNHIEKNKPDNKSDNW